jgi:AraC-like DNA-binding protein
MKSPPRERPPSHATVATGFVTGMLAGLAARPDGAARVRRLLAETGVAEAVLTASENNQERVGVLRYAELYNRLVRELDDEGFGLFATPLRIGSFEFLCRSVITAATLAEALDRAARFLRLVLPDFAIRVERPKSGSARLAIQLTDTSPLAARPLDDAARVFAFEWLLRLLHALACWLVGRGLALDAVRFPYPPPPQADDYALIYTEHSQFCAAIPAAETASHTTLVASFSANLLDLPVRRDDAALVTFLKDAPGKIALLYRRDRETVLRVRDLLRAALPELPALAEVASQLNLSERTLHRRLEEEGSNFRAIRDALRRDIALSRLTKSTLPLATLAAELGYAEASAFYRAVIGWTGLSPSQYRRKMLHRTQDV